MDITKLIYVTLLISISLFADTNGQTAEIEAIYTVSDAINSFALRFLAETSKMTQSNQNVALSPYTVWTLLTIIREGAQGDTARQLETVLNLPSRISKEMFRRNYKSYYKYLTQPNAGVQLEITNGIFTTSSLPLNQTFQQISQNFYSVDVMPVEFNNTPKAVETINSYIRQATKNRITDFVSADDIKDAAIFMTSALYFKGQWAVPFNKSATDRHSFYDESENKIADVMMMYQIGPFPYSRVEYLKAHAIELAYGKNNKMSMFVILPYRGQILSTILENIAAVPVSRLIQILAEAEQQFADEDIEVYLPRFKINTDYHLEGVLRDMGITDIFDDQRADLLGIFPHYLYVSHFVQKAEIEVNEEGTVATAASGATFDYRSPPPVFYANRPFAFIIVDKQTRSIIFAGTVRHPR